MNLSILKKEESEWKLKLNMTMKNIANVRILRSLPHSIKTEKQVDIIEVHALDSLCYLKYIYTGDENKIQFNTIKIIKY
jgi:hypothetical protein